MSEIQRKTMCIYHGNHTKCSKLRQAEAVERRAREKI